MESSQGWGLLLRLFAPSLLHGPSTTFTLNLECKPLNTTESLHFTRLVYIPFAFFLQCLEWLTRWRSALNPKNQFLQGWIHTCHISVLPSKDCPFPTFIFMSVLQGRLN